MCTRQYLKYFETVGIKKNELKGFFVLLMHLADQIVRFLIQ